MKTIDFHLTSQLLDLAEKFVVMFNQVWLQNNEEGKEVKVWV